jgi:hypothetical protein
MLARSSGDQLGSPISLHHSPISLPHSPTVTEEHVPSSQLVLSSLLSWGLADPFAGPFDFLTRLPHPRRWAG